MASKQMMGLFGLVFMVGMFFAASAVLMVLWNHVVIEAFADGSVKKVTYVQSLGLTLFLGMFIQGPRIVYDVSEILRDTKFSN